MNKSKFKIGDLVYLKTCSSQYLRQVTGMIIREDGLKYYVTDFPGQEIVCFGFELSQEKNVLVTLN